MNIDEYLTRTNFERLEYQLNTLIGFLNAHTISI